MSLIEKAGEKAVIGLQVAADESFQAFPRPVGELHLISEDSYPNTFYTLSPPSPFRDCVAMSCERVKRPKQSHNVLKRNEIAALPSVARNDKSQLRHSLSRERYYG